MQDMYQYMEDSIPADHCRQSTGISLALDKIKEHHPSSVVDLGCGRGKSYDVFKSNFKDIHWIGVDIEESPEVLSRTRSASRFVTYDGVNLPFADNFTDFVYSNQVLEHVQFPEMVLREVYRILRPNGLFVGQTSQLEPYHSYSYWNFTVYGFKRLCEHIGLTVEELRPGIDAQTLFKRTYLGRPKELSRYFVEESPLNQEIEEDATKKKLSNKIINHRKLLLCGQFCFVCRKAE